MKRIIGLVLLALGIVVAAAFGSLNGERHVEYRQAVAKQDMAETAVKVVNAGVELNQKLQKEGVDFSKMSAGEALEFVEKTPELKAQIQKTDDVFARLKQWGESDDPSMVAIAAKGDATAIGLPEPQQRLAQWFARGGIGWIVGLVLIVAGAALARMQDAAEATGTSPTSRGRVDFLATLAEVQRRIVALADEIETLAMDADASKPREALDRMDTELLTPLVEGRTQLIAKHGMGGFAEYFGAFSAGERNLNRCWSALTDGHAVVAREALVIAAAAFTAAEDGYRSVDGRG